MYTVTVCHEQIDDVIRQALTDNIDNLKKDLDKVIKSKKGFVFHSDFHADLFEITRMVQAHIKVLEYYGVKDLQ